MMGDGSRHWTKKVLRLDPKLKGMVSFATYVHQISSILTLSTAKFAAAGASI